MVAVDTSTTERVEKLARDGFKAPPEGFEVRIVFEVRWRNTFWNQGAGASVIGEYGIGIAASVDITRQGAKVIGRALSFEIDT